MTQADETDPLADLSPRERQIIKMVVKGQTSPMAAESIGGHCDQLLKK